MRVWSMALEEWAGIYIGQGGIFEDISLDYPYDA